MKRMVLAVAACLMMMTVGSGQTGKEEGKFSVRWYGQSFMTVTTPSGKIIAFDPQVMPEFRRNDKLKADVVCISHLHNDHDRVDEAIIDGDDEKKIKVFRGLKLPKSKNVKSADWNPIDEKIKVGDLLMHIRTFNCYHDGDEGKVRGKNAAFIVEVEGLTFCHLGDLGHELTEEDAKAIGPIDVLFVPCGGIYTINGTEAKKVVKLLKPKRYVFPMHYAVDNTPDALLPVNEFIDKTKNIRDAMMANEITLDSKTIPEIPTTVLLGWRTK